MQPTAAATGHTTKTTTFNPFIFFIHQSLLIATKYPMKNQTNTLVRSNFHHSINSQFGQTAKTFSTARLLIRTALGTKRILFIHFVITLLKAIKKPC